MNLKIKTKISFYSFQIVFHTCTVNGKEMPLVTCEIWNILTLCTARGWPNSRPPCRRNPQGIFSWGRWSQIISILFIRSFTWLSVNASEQKKKIYQWKNSKTWLYVRTAKIDKCVAIETNPSISFTLMTILQSLWKEREIQSLIRSRLSRSQLKLMWVNFTKYSEVHWPLFHGVSLLPRADICFFVDFFFFK